MIARPHGLHGDVVVHFMTNRTERTEAGAVFVTDRGDMTIEHVRRHGDRWIVGFAGISSLEEAEARRGLVLRATAIEDPDALWVHELLGAEVVDASDGRRLGTVAAVVENPASDLLEMDSGGLIPLHFVVEHRPGRVTVDVPPGLLD